MARDLVSRFKSLNLGISSAELGKRLEKMSEKFPIGVDLNSVAKRMAAAQERIRQLEEERDAGSCLQAGKILMMANRPLKSDPRLRVSPTGGVRWWLLKCIAWLLRLDLREEDPREDECDAHAQLRNVDPLLAGELSSDLTPAPPQEVCPICGKDPKKSGCRVDASWETKPTFSWNKDARPRLEIELQCDGQLDPWQAMETLVYWLRTKIPFPENAEHSPKYVGGGWYAIPPDFVQKEQGYAAALKAAKANRPEG